MTPKREVELFDRERFHRFPLTWHFDLEQMKPLMDFIQSECRRNRIEGAREFAEMMRLKKESNPYNADDIDLEAGWDDCAENINSQITQALAELEGKIEEVKG